MHFKLLTVAALTTILVAILSLGMATIKILCLGYACMQPCESKELNWPFLLLLGAFPKCNAGFQQWRGLAETLSDTTSLHYHFDSYVYVECLLTLYM